MIRVGVHSGQQYANFDECLELWTQAEELGYDWVSLFDHQRPPLGGPDGPCFDGPTLLAALAARTRRIRCGMLVSAVTWRHPAMAASIAATLDHVSGGRLEFGVGAGGADLAYDQYGLPFPRTGDRLDMLDEACEIMRGLWTRDRVDYEGEHYRLTGAALAPKPVQERLPLVIGGGGEKRTLRTVARHADVWNTLVTDIDTYRHKKDVLRGYCEEIGRNPDEIRMSMTFRVVLGEDETRAEERRRERMALLPAGSLDVGEYLAFGTAEQCVEALLPYVRLGVGDFLLGLRPPVDRETMRIFAERVAPALRQAAAGLDGSRSADLVRR
ncbi:TIGR03560 family F420-dependent LLM class oxidoreductase [Streptomyces sp. NPDC048332]|uniref:TIGR03560 family F420-dependent LLM class oxidoreductase n=1 Tax=Streptomyces sp. NPDC048332 TaxID=3154619 RepID=UPI003444D676